MKLSRTTLVLGVSCLLFAFAPASANAASVVHSGDTLVIEGDSSSEQIDIICPVVTEQLRVEINGLAYELGIQCSTIKNLIFRGGAGNDRVEVYTHPLNNFMISTADISGGPGNDIVHPVGLNNIVSGDDGNDIISGSPYARVFGGNGNDHINSSGSAETRGGKGTDTIQGTLGADYHIFGDGGNDRIYGNGGADWLVAGKGDDFVRGEGLGPDDGGADTLKGGPGKDNLNGNGGNDKIFGEKDNDKLTGGPGKDKLNGGKGRDLCIQEITGGYSC